jgi:general secretion pathway protein D
VIEQLDISRPQVLVEALIMEVDISDAQDLGFNGIARIVRGDTDYAIGSLTGLGSARPGFGGGSAGDGDGDGDGAGDGDGTIGDLADSVVSSLVAAASKNTLRDTDGDGVIDRGTLITGIITASARDGDAEILSAPHILTTDNEEAEIKVGANIPIITSRVQSAQGISQAANDLATSVNVERQDIGVTLRVTPQISEGDNVRLEIFQEITDINDALSQDTGDPEEVGVSLSNRKVENTVVVADGETVVIGGLISDDYNDTVTKVPWLGDIPFLGWLFKSTTRSLVKTNLLVFLTPHIVRESPELASQTIRKREEFRARSVDPAELEGDEVETEEERRQLAESLGIPRPSEREPVRATLKSHEFRYPLERMREIEADRRERSARAAEEASRGEAGPRYAVLAAVFRDERAATDTLTKLLDAGYEGTLVSGESEGTLLFEVRLGPFASLEEAEQAASVARQAFGLDPTVLVERAEP